MLRLFPTAELTNQSLDSAFVTERWPTRRSMEPRGYSQIHCRADQPVARCSGPSDYESIPSLSRNIAPCPAPLPSHRVTVYKCFLSLAMLSFTACFWMQDFSHLAPCLHAPWMFSASLLCTDDLFSKAVRAPDLLRIGAWQFWNIKPWWK